MRDSLCKYAQALKPLNVPKMILEATTLVFSGSPFGDIARCADHLERLVGSPIDLKLYLDPSGLPASGDNPMLGLPTAS